MQVSSERCVRHEGARASGHFHGAHGVLSTFSVLRRGGSNHLLILRFQPQPGEKQFTQIQHTETRGTMLLFRGVLLAMLTFWASQVSAQARTPFTGKGLTGTGRACNGDLRIYPGYLDYSTSFFECSHVRYKKIQEDPRSMWAYRFTSAATKRCPYQLLVVLAPDPQGGFWRAVAWSSEAAWRKKDHDKEDSCPMY